MNFEMNAEDSAIMSEINMTPLVDVMLVLLIIFMITMPVIQHSVKVDLPQASNRTNDLRPPHVNLTLMKDGALQWDQERIPVSQLPDRVARAAEQNPQPELHLYAERQTPYEKVAQVMAMAQSGGLTRIGFVTDPQREP